MEIYSGLIHWPTQWDNNRDSTWALAWVAAGLRCVHLRKGSIMFTYKCTPNKFRKTVNTQRIKCKTIDVKKLHHSGIPFPVWLRTMLIKWFVQNLITNKRTTVYVPDVQTYLRAYRFLPGHKEVTAFFTAQLMGDLECKNSNSSVSLVSTRFWYQCWLVYQHCKKLLWRNTNCTWSNTEQ